MILINFNKILVVIVVSSLYFRTVFAESDKPDIYVMYDIDKDIYKVCTDTDTSTSATKLQWKNCDGADLPESTYCRVDSTYKVDPKYFDINALRFYKFEKTPDGSTVKQYYSLKFNKFYTESVVTHSATIERFLDANVQKEYAKECKDSWFADNWARECYKIHCKDEINSQKIKKALQKIAPDSVLGNAMKISNECCECANSISNGVLLNKAELITAVMSLCFFEISNHVKLSRAIFMRLLAEIFSAANDGIAFGNKKYKQQELILDYCAIFLAFIHLFKIAKLSSEAFGDKKIDNSENSESVDEIGFTNNESNKIIRMAKFFKKYADHAEYILAVLRAVAKTNLIYEWDWLDRFCTFLIFMLRVVEVLVETEYSGKASKEIVYDSEMCVRMDGQG